MRLRIQLPAKAGSFRISNCETEKVLILSDEAFQAFLDQPIAEENMVTKYDYLSEDSGRVYCGVLVLGEEREDGVFAYDRGRHFSYLPGARAMVDSVLARAVEMIVREGTENTNEGNWCYYFSELYEQMGLVVESGNGLDAMLLDRLERRPEVADAVLTDECFDICYYLDCCKNLTQKAPLPAHASDRKSVLYQVVEQGHSVAFVCKHEDGPADLHGLLTRAASIAEGGNSSFAEALLLAANECGIPLRPAMADEAEALSHDLSHGGPADQRVVIDLDDHRIRVEYDHQANSLKDSLDMLAKSFPPAVSGKIQSRLISFLAEHDGSEELYQVLHRELGMTNREIEAMGFGLEHRYESDANDAYQDIVDYIQFEQETSEVWAWAIPGDEILANKDALQGIANRLAAAGAWDTERIYQELNKIFGINPALSPDQGPELKL